MSNFRTILFLCTLTFMCISFTSQAQSDGNMESKEEIVEEETTKGESPEEAELFTIVEQMPEYKEGKEAMLKFIYSTIMYPAEARENAIQGTVIVSFVVTDSGSLERLKIRRSIGGGCDEEAIRVVKLMDGNWTPGIQRGQAVNVAYNLPVRFKLETSEEPMKKKKRKKLFKLKK